MAATILGAQAQAQAQANTQAQSPKWEGLSIEQKLEFLQDQQQLLLREQKRLGQMHRVLDHRIQILDVKIDGHSHDNQGRVLFSGSTVRDVAYVTSCLTEIHP